MNHSYFFIQDRARYEAQMKSLENQLTEREAANKKRMDKMLKVIEKKAKTHNV